ncbi:Flotillin-2 [Liparis tanakae]|uniref:Flotillin n=1 Tax=Liparis tanakae TaxID=230148 RepID=A0A4Z2IJ07_9TELE|nr:Flotillin-2 [Liparis tanakae]
MGSCLTVGPNEALVVSGDCCGADTKTYAVGGWAWAWCLISDTQRITLEIMTLQPRCEDVETAEGVAITVTGVAQVKVMTEHDLLAIACEQFLGKSVVEIKAVVLQTLEGHLRSILGTLTVEQIYQDRDQFAKLVREVASPDVGRMGIEILSFTIKVGWQRQMRPGTFDSEPKCLKKVLTEQRWVKIMHLLKLYQEECKWQQPNNSLT